MIFIIPAGFSAILFIFGNYIFGGLFAVIALWILWIEIMED